MPAPALPLSSPLPSTPSALPLCAARPDFDGDGTFRLADAVFAAEVWKGSKAWSGPVCRFGDFDQDGTMRLADAVFAAEVWAGSKAFADG